VACGSISLRKCGSPPGRKGFTNLSEQFIEHLAAFRELIVPICAPRSNHRKLEQSAVAKLESIDVRVVMLDPVGGICDVELDRPVATRLEVDSAQAARGLQEVAGMRFAAQ
jgi:hypothetical protein